MKLSIVIPAYNERNRIQATLEGYITHFSKRYDLELIVVLNGCIDGTRDIVSDLAREYSGIKVMDFPQRLGKGGAVIEGFKVADGDIIGFTDADRSVQAAEFEKLLTALSDFDGAIASRGLSESKAIVKETEVRKFARWGLRSMVRVLFGSTFEDTQCGAKLFREYVIKEITPELGTKNSAFDIDLLYRVTRRGYRVQEVPITWLYDTDTRLKLKDVILPMFFSLLRLRMKTLIRR
jgi:glycosyltransferase involved in cell wall biosynthesis